MDLLPFDPGAVIQVSASVRREGGIAEFRYSLSDGAEHIVIPPRAVPHRAAALWHATCFQAFIATGAKSYVELDFSPSGEWAAYQFNDYRQGMQQLDVGAADVRLEGNSLIARVDLPERILAGAAVGLAAALEHCNGTRSYWALAHPNSNRPDFHARDCFVAQLP